MIQKVYVIHGHWEKVPCEIAEKVSEYQIAMQKADKLYKEVKDWLEENTDAEWVCIEEIFITDKPTGRKQGVEGEYCDQHEWGDSGDDFYGTYYHQIEGSEKYVAYKYNS